MNDRERPEQAQAEILIVEDSPTQAEQLAYTLQQHGFRTEKALNGQQALDYLATHQPKLILSDIVMPTMDGYELCRRVRSDMRLKHVPLILLTALSDPREVLKALQCGADNFLTKPYSEEYLLSRVDSLFSKRGLAGEEGEEGTEIVFEGEHYFITAERRQILALLVSIYETAVQKNRALLATEDELRELNQVLEKRVEGRTVELEKQVVRRERAEDLMRERLTEIEQIYRYAPVGLYFLNRDHRFLRLNEQLARVGGASVEECIGRSVWELVPGLAGRLVELSRPVFERGEPVLNVELHGRVSPAAAEERDWVVSLFPFRAAAGDVVALIGAVLEITERKRADVEVRRLAAIVESSDDAIFGKTLDGVITSWNMGAERLYGYKAGEILGRSVVLLSPPDRIEEILTFLEQVRNGRPVEHFETLRLRKDGTPIDISLTVSPIRDPSGRIVGASSIARDITERRRAQRALENLNTELQQTLAELRASQAQVIQAEKMAAVGTMMAGVVHELNNPLMGVMNYVEYAQENPAEPDIAQMLGRAHAELQRMGDLLNNMLMFARPGGGEKRETLLDEVVERVAGLMRADFRGRGISLEIISEAPVPSVWSQPERLQQVFMNLLLNARDAVKDSAHKSVSIRAWSDERDVHVAFTDTGHGVPVAVQGRIFEPFFTTKPPGEGTGMGLAVSKNIVSELGGELTFTSEEGKGATFSIRIPREPVPPRD